MIVGQDYERKNNSGTLGKNTYKNPQNPADAKKPDYNGNALINGQEMKVSAWLKEGKNGKFFSLQFQAKDGNGQQQSNRSRPSQDDDVPF